MQTAQILYGNYYQNNGGIYLQEILVSELKPHPMNDYYFDDMEGQKWREFLESVKTSGIFSRLRTGEC